MVKCIAQLVRAMPELITNDNLQPNTGAHQEVPDSNNGILCTEGMNMEQIQTIKPRVGDLFETSWGYDQTNYDFIIVESITPSGKTAMCRMAAAEGPQNESMGHNWTPKKEAYGKPFRMKIEESNGDPRLRGSYFFSDGSYKRLDTFYPVEKGKVYHSTGYA